MRQSLTCLLSACALLGACTSTRISPAGSMAPPQWTLVWSDEFTGAVGARVDSTKWRYETGDGCAVGNCGWGNGEKESYTSSTDNVSLNGTGQLMITARTALGISCYYGPCAYTSAKITTRGTVLAAPGRVEARIKLPNGQGLWPAFWMLGGQFPAIPWPQSGELDIMEHKGSESLTTSSAIHGPGYSGNTPFAHRNTLARGSVPDEYHVYAVEWDSASVRFSVDSVPHYAVTRGEITRYGTWVFDQPMYVILNLAVGGAFDGDPKSDAIVPATMLVDYVRVYVHAR